MDVIPQIKITETPRDAMQGWDRIIPAELKAAYINSLFEAGFDTIDCGSFVSPKAVPQMADTEVVLSKLQKGKSNAHVMVIVGNKRGGDQAVRSEFVNILGYPYSVSEIFLNRNLNTTNIKAWQTVLDLKEMCDQAGKALRVYLTMAFGNPYGDIWSDELVLKEIENLREAGIHNIVLSDTNGTGNPATIKRLCFSIMKDNSMAELGVHFHTSALDWQDKVESAWNAGFRNFESALGGFGGCPMTGYELLANLNTLDLVDWCNRHDIPTGLNEEALRDAQQIASQVFI